MEKTQEPTFETQLDYDGRPEKVDITKQSVRVLCSEPGCFQVRYVHAQDAFQSDRCKPHARAARLKSRAERARIKRKSSKTVSNPQ
jgi:hypothetical protein